MSKKSYAERNLKFETLQLHVGQEQADIASDARAVPIYQTTSYVFRNSQHAADRFGLADPGNIYGRLTNSTQDVLEKRVAALEGGVAALAVASGAAAISYTIEALAGSGDNIVAQKTIYGGSYNLFLCSSGFFFSCGSNLFSLVSATFDALFSMLLFLHYNFAYSYYRLRLQFLQHHLYIHLFLHLKQKLSIQLDLLAVHFLFYHLAH